MYNTKFSKDYGYYRDMTNKLELIGADNPNSVATCSANQIKHLKSAVVELISIVEAHQAMTETNFAWAELEYAKEALFLEGE